MKTTSFLAIAILLQLPAMAAVSLDAGGQSSVFQDSDPVLKDLSNEAPDASVGKAETAFAAGKYEDAVRLAKPLERKKSGKTAG